MASKLKTIFFASLLLNFFVLLLFGGKIIDHTPFMDDIETISAGHFRYGLNYFDWHEKKLWFRPIEYYIYALLALVGKVNLMIVFSYFFVAMAGAIGAVMIASSQPFVAPAAALLAGLVLTVHPIVASPAFRISILSQCLSNLGAALLLWQLLRKKRNDILIVLIFIIGALSKESFVPYIVLASILFYVRDRDLKIPLIGAVIIPIYLVARRAVIDGKLLAAVDRYQVGFGPNVIKNLLLHLAGLFYFGSSPDLFAGNLSREWPSLLVSAFFWALAVFLLLTSALTKEKIYILLFAGISLFPGILTQGVAEHNISPFVYFMMLFVLFELQARLTPRLLLPLLAVVALVSSLAILQKTTLLSETIQDFRRMRALAHAGQPVTCLRKFDKTYSFYRMNSAKLADWYLVYDKPGLPVPRCAPAAPLPSGMSSP